MQDLQTFRTVAQQGSLVAAARLLDCDPSAVSRTIAGLESELGVRLFQRTTRRIDLTEAGELYLRRVEVILDELAAAHEEALGLVAGPRGRLRVTASNAYGQTVLAPLIQPFRHAYPEIEIELLLTDALVDLVREQVDVALRLGPRPTGDLVIARLSDVAMRLVASPDVARRLGKPAQPDDFTALPCLIAANQPRARWHFKREDMQAVIEVRGTISTSNTLALRQFARDGLGYAVLPDWLVDGDIAAGHLVDVMPDWQMTPGDFEAGVWITYPSRRFLPSKTRAFIDFLTSRARDRQSLPLR